MKLSYQIVSPPSEAKDLAPVILLHGRMDSKKTWKNLAPEIAAKTGRKVFCLDARNHGDSPWCDEMNFEALTQDLQDFLKEQKISRAVFVGHSLGGRTAMTFTLRKPEVVEKLIVEDMVTTNYPPIARRSVMQIMDLLRQSLTIIPPDADELTAKTAVVEFVKAQLPPARPGGKQSNVFDLDTIPLKKEDDNYMWQANLDVLEKMLTSETNDQTLTGSYAGDALFLYGTYSFFDVPNDENINKFFPNAVKVPFEGAGHLIHQDFPKEFLDHVIRFINS